MRAKTYPLDTSESALAMPDAPGLYRIDFPNGKSCIGVSRKSMRVRALTHFTDARRGKNSLVAPALRKYGPLAVFRPMAICEDPESLSIMEERAVRIYSTLAPGGYNLVRGGLEIGPAKGHSVSEETRAKMRASKMNRPRTAAEHAHLLDMARKRGPATEVQRASISQKLKARGTPNWANGHPHRLEVRVSNIVYESISAAAKAFGLSSIAVSWRIKSPNFANWSYNNGCS